MSGQLISESGGQYHRNLHIDWTKGGKLKVKADGSDRVIIVSSEDVKKVADRVKTS